VEVKQPMKVEPKMRGSEIRNGANLQGALKQKRRKKKALI